jgi:hypothetical protein
MQKYFTVKDATDSLMLVSPITSDIMRKRKRMIEIKKLLKEGEENKGLGFMFIKESAKTELRETSREITYHLAELEQIGCYLKDFELGVIDFPSVLNGRVVFLSWKYGESTVRNWHELSKSYENNLLINK